MRKWLGRRIITFIAREFGPEVAYSWLAAEAVAKAIKDELGE